MQSPALDAMRTRLLEAAKGLLGEANASFGFDLVAARAGVARSILQQQFRSQAGLLEALYDQLWVEAHARERVGARVHGIAAYVAEIARIWDGERVVIRRLRALAAFDAELAAALELRDVHRREGLLRIIEAERSAHAGTKPRELVERVFALTSFECFDALAGSTRSIASVAPLMQELARAAQRGG